MTESPYISALLPIWTGAEYLEESINSVLSQTFTDWELFIIGEPDGACEIKETVLRYAGRDSRIHWIQNETHLGVAGSLNKGIELASGKYIARIDVDSPSYPIRFERQVQYLDEHPDIDILGTQFRTIFPNRIEVGNFPTNPENIKAALLFWCYILHSSLMIRRKTLMTKGFRYPKAISEDHALWLSILDNAIFVTLDEILIDGRSGFGTNSTHIRRSAILAEATLRISKAINKYFHIDTDKLPSNRFMVYEWSFEQIRLAEFSEWMTDSIRLLLEMENENKQHRRFNDTALARTLRKRWNWILDGSLVSKISDLSPTLPNLVEKSENLFSVDLANALLERRLLTDPPAQAPSIDSIVCIVQNLAAKFVNYLTELFKTSPAVVIFGIGYYCDKFLTECPDTYHYFNLIGFCDNNLAKQGQIKHDKPIFAIHDILQLDFDYILIATKSYYNEVCSQLISMNFSANKLLPLDIFRYKVRP